MFLCFSFGLISDLINQIASSCWQRWWQLFCIIQGSHKGESSCISELQRTRYQGLIIWVSCSLFLRWAVIFGSAWSWTFSWNKQDWNENCSCWSRWHPIETRRWSVHSIHHYQWPTTGGCLFFQKYFLLEIICILLTGCPHHHRSEQWDLHSVIHSHSEWQVCGVS